MPRTNAQKLSINKLNEKKALAKITLGHPDFDIRNVLREILRVGAVVIHLEDQADIESINEAKASMQADVDSGHCASLFDTVKRNKNNVVSGASSKIKDRFTVVLPQVDSSVLSNYEPAAQPFVKGLLSIKNMIESYMTSKPGDNYEVIFLFQV